MIKDTVDGITKMKNMLLQRVPTLSWLTSIFTKEKSGAEEERCGGVKYRDDAINDIVLFSPVSDIPHELASDPASFPPTSAAHTHQEELRCIIIIIRHGDRTPKQKLKDTVKGEQASSNTLGSNKLMPSLSTQCLQGILPFLSCFSCVPKMLLLSALKPQHIPFSQKYHQGILYMRP